MWRGKIEQQYRTKYAVIKRLNEILYCPDRLLRFREPNTKEAHASGSHNFIKYSYLYVKDGEKKTTLLFYLPEYREARHFSPTVIQFVVMSMVFDPFYFLSEKKNNK